MAYDLNEKVVVITGGAGGIGAKVVEYMLEEGAKHVAFLDILEEKGIALQDKLRKKFGDSKVKYHNCNILDEDQLFAAIQSVIDEYGYIDIFVNNAGIWNDSWAFYKKEIQLNVTTLVTCTIKAMELMRKDKGGKGGVIINVSSIAALAQLPYTPIYFATKSAVLQFSNCVGMPEYYNKYGVRVIAVCFGPTDTALLSRELVGTFDTDIDNGLMDFIHAVPSQKTESAAKAVLEICKRGESGSTWLATNDQPAKDITDAVKKAYGILADTFLKK